MPQTDVIQTEPLPQSSVGLPRMRGRFSIFCRFFVSLSRAAITRLGQSHELQFHSDNGLKNGHHCF